MKPINPWPLIAMLVLVVFPLPLAQWLSRMNEVTKITTAKDWASDQEVRWCPGCGDYAVLKAVQRTMPDLGTAREKTVFISGIGCSSRFPYYMASYGFHTIHGRACAVATGTKLANPELDVWIITGDGDALSIGGNHTMHLLRRNLDCQLLLFNNEIYGLTKGQYSPTSRIGTRSPSTPFGSVDRPANPCAFALGSGARFVARGIDVHKNLVDVLKAAHAHKGASFIEIFQNCVVYNDDVFAPFTDKRVAADKQLWLVAGREDAVRGRDQGPRARHGPPHAEGRRRRQRRGASSTIRAIAPSRTCWSKCRPRASRSRSASSTRIRRRRSTAR